MVEFLNEFEPRSKGMRGPTLERIWVGSEFDGGADAKKKKTRYNSVQLGKTSVKPRLRTRPTVKRIGTART